MVEKLNSTFIQMLCNLTEKLKRKWKNSINKPKFAFNSTRHSATGLVSFLLPERKLNLPIDVILRQYRDKSDGKQTDYNRYTQQWEDKRSEAFKIADDSTKVRNVDKRHKDQKGTFKPLEVARKFLSGI